MRRMWILGLAVLAACGGSSDAPTSPTQVTFAGTYTLQTVNGQKLPFVIAQSGTNAVTLTSASLTIAAGGTWSDQFNYTQTTNGVPSAQTATENGTWVRSGSNLALDLSTGTLDYSGTFSGNTVTLSDGTFTYVLTK